MSYDDQYLYLTTRGRKSGLPREIEIWFTHHSGRFYLIAEHSLKANWVQNILQESRISFRVGAHHFEGNGRIVGPENDSNLVLKVRSLSEEKYGWSDGLIVELTPNDISVE